MDDRQLVVEIPTETGPAVEVVVKPEHLKVSLEAFETQVDHPEKQGRKDSVAGLRWVP